MSPPPARRRDAGRRGRRRWGRASWFDEARRATTSLAASMVVGVSLGVWRGRRAVEADVLLDNVILTLITFLLVYVLLTVWVFWTAPATTIRDWARRERRGTRLQRYVMGTAPGPGLAIFVSALSLTVGMFWLPRGDEVTSTLPALVHLAAAVVVLVLAWLSVVVSFAVVYLSDDAIEGGRALEFPGDEAPCWTDYVYLAVAITTSFGSTDVVVRSPVVRRQVTVNAVVAFVFNTVILGTVVTLLAA